MARAMLRAMAGDEAYDELFSGPVEEFVAKRDALVRQLKADGDKDQAAVVKAWRRPTRVVAALNRLAVTDAGTAATFADAARAVGSSRGPALRAANEQFRAAVRSTATAAVDGLDEPRASDLGEITTALLTLGADPGSLASFEEGRLLELPEAGQGGFGFGGGFPAGEPEPEPEPDDQRREAERARLQEEVDTAGTELREAEEDRDRAQQALADATEQADSANRALDDATRALEAAEAALADLDG